MLSKIPIKEIKMDQQKNNKINSIIAKNNISIKELEDKITLINKELETTQQYSLRFYELSVASEQLNAILHNTKDQNRLLDRYREMIINKEFDIIDEKTCYSSLEKQLSTNPKLVNSTTPTQELLKREKMIASQMPNYDDRYAILLEKRNNETISPKETKEIKKLSNKREIAYVKAQIHKVRVDLEKKPQKAQQNSLETLKRLENRLKELKHPKLHFLKDILSDIDSLFFPEHETTYEEDKKRSEEIKDFVTLLLLTDDDDDNDND